MIKLRNIRVHPAYLGPLVCAAVLQAVVLFGTGMVLDCGVLGGIARICGLAFWTSVVMLIVRNPVTPRKVDLLYIWTGPLVVTVAGYHLTMLIWHLRGF